MIVDSGMEAGMQEQMVILEEVAISLDYRVPKG